MICSLTLMTGKKGSSRVSTARQERRGVLDNYILEEEQWHR